MATYTADDVCQVLAAEDRRQIVDCLDADDTLTTDALAERVAESTEGSVNEVGLHHVHLPKLDRHGVVDWDGDRIERGEAYADTRWLLEAIRSLDIDD